MQGIKRYQSLLLGLTFFSSLHAEDQNALAVSKMLGWVNVETPNQCPINNSCLNCGGYYDESGLPAESNISFKDAEVVINAPPPPSIIN